MSYKFIGIMIGAGIIDFAERISDKNIEFVFDQMLAEEKKW